MIYSFDVIKDEDFTVDDIVAYPEEMFLNVKKCHEVVFNPLFTDMNVFGYENIGYVVGMCKEFKVKTFADFFERVYTNESLGHAKKNLRGKTRKEIYDIVCSMKEYAKNHGVGDIPLHILFLYFLDVACYRTSNGYFHELLLNKEAAASGKYEVIGTTSAYDDAHNGIDSIFIAKDDTAMSHAVQLKPHTFAIGDNNPKLRSTRKSFLWKSKKSHYPFFMYFYKEGEGYMVNDKCDDTYPNACCFKVDELFDENGSTKKGNLIKYKQVVDKIPF